MRRPAPLLLLLAALLLLPGCVYLRLLALKVQFADFDRHCEVATEPQITLRFKDPPLLAEDIGELIGAHPSATAAYSAGEVRSYAFARIGEPGETAPPRILVLTVTVEQGRVAAIAFPRQVSLVVPPALAAAALRSLGHAQVDKVRFSATARVEAPAAAAAQVPGRARLREVLGDPAFVQPQDDGGERWVYRYRLHAQPLPGRPPVLAAIAFVFRPGGDRPARFSANIAGKWLYLDLP
jgi:hypothetical protein